MITDLKIQEKWHLSYFKKLEMNTATAMHETTKNPQKSYMYFFAEVHEKIKGESGSYFRYLI